VDFAHHGALVSALDRNRCAAIVYADASGRIMFWNAGAEAIFGHSPAEALGRQVDLIVPEDHREMHWAGFHRAMGAAWRGSAAWSPIEGLHKDGRMVSLEVFLTPMQEEDDAAKGALAIFRAPA